MRILLLILSFVVSLGLLAQTAAQADALFNEQKYEESGRAYASLLSKRPNDALYNYRYARCSYETGKYEDAITHFIKSGTRYPLRDYYLADSYFISYQFEEAITYFTDYLEASPSIQFKTQAEDRLKRSHLAARLIRRVEDIEIIDSLMVNKKDFLKHYDLSKETGQYTTKTALAPDKRTIDLISFVTQRADRKIFSDLVDNYTRLFASNKLLIAWSKPEYVSENINADGDQNYPFLMLDGVTLYFAANGESSLGGYDIFITRFNPNINDYLIPENIGFPFNSIYNDYMYVVDETRGIGWFVTDRHQIRDKVCIYRFRYQDEKSYINTEDSDYLISAAQLKKYKKADLSSFTEGKNTEENDEEQGIKVEKIENTEPQTIVFQINDTLDYTNTKQFISRNALKHWQEWQKLTQNLNNKEQALSSLRSQYTASKTDKEKARFADEIISIEKEILVLRPKIQALDIKIKNEEINAISKKL